MTVDTIKVGLCGLGTVGSGVVNVLQRNLDVVQAHADCAIELVHIGARRPNPNCDPGALTSAPKISEDIFAVANDPEVQILIELIGGTTVAKDLVINAIQNGKHVITANKALIAEFGTELFALAAEHGVVISYEASVAGGIPIIKTMREGLAANNIEWLAGIINGTGNFILTAMAEEKREFADVLKQAQELGYAEADPTFDVEGIDAAHKLVILTSLAFGMPLQFDGVFTEGISTVQPQDLAYAKELGYRIKHLGVARRHGDEVEMRVHPTLIPEEQLLANVNGVMNAVLVHGDAVGPTLYAGGGAGAGPTASAIVADLVDLARDLSHQQTPAVPLLGFASDQMTPLTVQSMDELHTAHYVRLTVQDKPGVLSEITKIFSSFDISIEAVIQKQPKSGAAMASIIMITDVVREGRMKQALKDIESLSTVSGPATRIRVESLD